LNICDGSLNPHTHLLLQVRTRTLNGTLRETFQGWWLAMATVSASLWFEEVLKTR